MNKHIALRLLKDDDTVPCAEIMSKLSLDINGDENIAIEVKFYSRKNTLYVTFGSQHHAELLDRFKKAGREGESLNALNSFIQELQVGFSSRVVEELFVNLIKEVNSNSGFTTTVFVGSGIPACLASMIAAVSPPHFLYTFGMPAFSNGRPYADMELKALQKKRRLKKDGIAVKSFVSEHFINASEKTFIPISDYTLPQVVMGSTVDPSFLRRVVARCFAWKRSAAPNLEAYFNENSAI